MIAESSQEITEDSETRYGCKDQLYGRKSLMPDKLSEASESKG